MNDVRRGVFTTLALALGLFQPLSAHSVYQQIAASIAPHDLAIDHEPKSIEERMRPPMTPARNYFTTLELFSHAEKPCAGIPLLDPESWQDFVLFPPAGAQRTDSVIERIDRTSTVFGKAALAGMLVGAGGTPSIPELERRQAIVKTLLAQPELLTTIEESLQQLKNLEPFFLRFFSAKNSEREKVLSSYYIDRGDHPLAETFNKQYQDYQRKPWWYIVNGTADRFMTLLGFVGVITTAQSLWSWVSGYRNVPAMLQNIGGQLGHVQQAAVNWRLPAAIALGGYGVWKGLTQTEAQLGQFAKLVRFPEQVFIETPNRLKHLLVTNRVLHEDLIQLAQGLETMRGLSSTLGLAGVPKLVPECKSFFMLCNKPEQLSNDIRSLVEMLQTSTFKGKPSLFCHFGRLFAANYLIQQTKKSWASIFKSIGYLDAYVSLARLIKEHEASRVKYCFVQYLESKKPRIELKDFWYPVVGVEQAVVNDLTFGEQEQNIILTGPFASGKSTIMRDLGVSVLMAQTLGIAPAASMKLTPFTVINTSMNISDSPAYNLSGLMAELDAAKGMLAQVTQLKPHQFCLNIFDEIFRATNETDGEVILNRFVKKMAVPHALNIFATHKQGDKIRNLEAEFAPQKLFANYKVESPDGKVPDFKLKRGWTRQSLLHESTLQKFGI